jgi:hypothetical protein
MPLCVDHAVSCSVRTGTAKSRMRPMDNYWLFIEWIATSRGNRTTPLPWVALMRLGMA